MCCNVNMTSAFDCGGRRSGERATSSRGVLRVMDADLENGVRRVL